MIVLLGILLLVTSCGEKPQFRQEADMMMGHQVVMEDLVWKNSSTIIVKFQNGTNEQKNEVIFHALEWTRYANLQFVFVDSNGKKLSINYDQRSFRLPIGKENTYQNYFDRSDIRISFTENTNNSIVGTGSIIQKPNEATMNLGTNIKLKSVRRGSILHEFGHALGLMHEHQNAKRRFKFNQKNVYAYCESRKIDEISCKSNMLETYSNGTSTFYDPESVMNYVFDDNVYTQESVEQDLTPRPHHFLSLKDKMFIASLYPGRARHDQIKEEHEILKNDFEKVGRCVVLKPNDIDIDGQFSAACGPAQFAIGIYLENQTRPVFALGTCQKSLSKTISQLQSAVGCE